MMQYIPPKKHFTRQYKRIPVEFGEKDFTLFVLSHLSVSKKGRKPQIPLQKIFNLYSPRLASGNTSLAYCSC